MGETKRTNVLVVVLVALSACTQDQACPLPPACPACPTVTTSTQASAAVVPSGLPAWAKALEGATLAFGGQNRWRQPVAGTLSFSGLTTTRVKEPGGRDWDTWVTATIAIAMTKGPDTVNTPLELFAVDLTGVERQGGVWSGGASVYPPAPGRTVKAEVLIPLVQDVATLETREAIVAAFRFSDGAWSTADAKPAAKPRRSVDDDARVRDAQSELLKRRIQNSQPPESPAPP